MTRAVVELQTKTANVSLAEHVAKATYSIKVKGGKDPAVTFSAHPKKGQSLDMAALNAGHVRHPVFAKGTNRNQWTWVDQTIQPGWFDTAMSGQIDTIRTEMLAAMEKVAAELNASLKTPGG